MPQAKHTEYLPSAKQEFMLPTRIDKKMSKAEAGARGGKKSEESRRCRDHLLSRPPSYTEYLYQLGEGRLSHLRLLADIIGSKYDLLPFFTSSIPGVAG